MNFKKLIVGSLAALAMTFSSCAANIENMAARDSKLNLNDPFVTEAVAETANGDSSSAVFLSNFKTKYNVNPKARATNIALAANSINGKIIKPGEIFSYNRAIGSTTAEKGYKKAKIFVNGKEEEGMGGGICQVSSTLYNAAKAAGMEIIERHPHSKKVYYVGDGNDAAVSPGGIDFKFRNIKNFNVQIVAKAENGEVSTGIIQI